MPRERVIRSKRRAASIGPRCNSKVSNFRREPSGMSGHWRVSVRDSPWIFPTRNEALKKTSFRELAKLAKVSTATVSRIVRGQANVDPEMRARVHKAAEVLGIDIEQRRQEKSTIIAFILGNRTVLHNFQARVLSGAESYCSSQSK